MLDQKQWYLNIRGQKKGPFSESSVWKLYASGTVRKNTPVWSDGMSGWTLFSQTDLFRDMPPAVKSAQSGSVGKIIVITIVVLIIIAAGIFGFRSWRNMHSLTGAWQGKNVLGLTLTMYFQPNARIGSNTMDVFYEKGSNDEPTNSFYYVAAPISNNVYRIDFCSYSADAGTIDEANERSFTITLNWDGSAQIDGFSGGYSTFSRIDGARAKSFLNIQ